MLNDKEKLEVNNLLKLIRRSTFKEFEGVEALALARAYHWLESLLKEPTPLPQEPLKSITTQVPMPLQPIEEKNIIIPSSVIPHTKRKKAKNG